MPENENMKVIQRTQNALLRVLTGKKLTDQVRVKDMLEDCNMLLVNQMAAQVKIAEIWKLINIPDYPIKMERRSKEDRKMTTRSAKRGDVVIKGAKEHNVPLTCNIFLRSFYSINQLVCDFIFLH